VAALKCILLAGIGKLLMKQNASGILGGNEEWIVGRESISLGSGSQ
jgi:hypothetical protein